MFHASRTARHNPRQRQRGPHDRAARRGQVMVLGDTDFDAAAPAFYYGRVLEIPTPRWTAYDAKRFGIQPLPGTRMTLQGRAYTSPIWYTP